MKKINTVRQNRCDGEMNVLFFGCFILYTVLQLFSENMQQFRFADALNLMLYMVFVPGFLFMLGYRFRWNLHTQSAENAKKSILHTAARCYGYFFLLALGQEMFLRKLPFSYSVTEILTVITVPSVSAIFFTMALTLVFVWVFFDGLCHLTKNSRRGLAALGLLCLLGAFLWNDQETYAVVAAFTGSSVHQAVPGIPYFSFFLLGIWFEEKKPGFDWKLFGISVAVTVVSALLYRTPLRVLCRVTISALPVYLVYVSAEFLSDITLRFRTAKFVSTTIERVYLVYTALLFGILGWGITADMSWKRVLVLAVLLLALLYLVVLGFNSFGSAYEKAVECFESRVRHRTAVYFLFYTLAFWLMLALVFSEFIRLGKSFVWTGDGLTQYYPRALYFCRYIRELVSNILSGNFTLPMYDFTIGFGSEITYSLEPLYFLYALFGEEHIEFAYNLVTLLRFYLAGITSSVLFLYFKKDYFASFLGSIVYVFCGFALYGGAKHTMFMIPMIMLPLLIISMEEILRKRRWYLCTVFVAISLFSNYYYLYMNTIAMGIYFLVRFFCQKKREDRTVRNFISRGLVICGSYLLGVGMSCIVLVTTFGMYLGSGRSGSISISTPSLFYYSANRLVRTFLTFLTTANSPGDWLKLGYLPIAMLAVVFLFLRKGRKELKIFCVISLVFLAFPLSGFVFSGFSAIVNRWCYMISLLVGFIVASCYGEMLRLTKRDVRILGGTVILYGFLVFYADVQITQSTRYTKLAFLFLAVTFIVLLFGQESYKKLSRASKQCMIFLLTAVFVFAQGYTEFAMNSEIDAYVDRDRTQEKITDTPLAAMSEIEDDSFYRSSVTQLDYLTSSASLILDFNPVTMVCSTLNQNVMEYLGKMGCTSYSATQLLGLGCRTYLSALASVKYYARYGGQSRPLPYGYEQVLKTEVNGRTAKVSENQYALPLGYTYSKAISEEELEQYDVAKRQEVMMQRVVLGDVNRQSMEDSDDSQQQTGPDSDITVTGKRCAITSFEEKGITYSDSGFTAGGDYRKYRLKLQFEGLDNSETYLVLKNAVPEGASEDYEVLLTVKAGENTVSYRFRSEDYRYGSGQSDYMINLGYYEEGIDSCTIRMDSAGTLKFDDFAVYCQPMENTKQYTDALTENVMEQVEVDTNRISGKISLDEDKYLVLSIPYQGGWSALVDGRTVKPVRANYMYMAIPLEAGDHTIELSFEIPGVKYALAIMAASVVLFTGLCLITFFRNRRRKKVK